MNKLTKKEKCISVFQIQVWYSYGKKYKLDNKVSSELFDKNNIWDYIKDVYDVIENDPLIVIIKNIKKIIDNGGYKYECR